MPSNLSQGAGVPGVPLGEIPTDRVGVNASKPRTFVPPVGANTGQPGRPPSLQQGAGAAGGGGIAGVGTVPAPPNIAQLTNPQALLQGGGGATGGGALPTGVPGFTPMPGQLAYDPLTGTWHLPDGTTRPGVGG